MIRYTLGVIDAGGRLVEGASGTIGFGLRCEPDGRLTPGARAMLVGFVDNTAEPLPRPPGSRLVLLDGHLTPDELVAAAAAVPAAADLDVGRLTQFDPPDDDDDDHLGGGGGLFPPPPPPHRWE